MTLKVSFQPFFSIDNFPKDNFKIPSNTRQLFIVWHLWNLLDTWKTTRSLRCFCTPQRIGNLECWKLSHHKITLQGTISHLKKAGKSSSRRAFGKRICYFPGGYPLLQQFFLVHLKFVLTFITLWYTDIAMNNNKNPSTKTWTATEKVILGTKARVQCKKSTMQTTATKKSTKP